MSLQSKPSNDAEIYERYVDGLFRYATVLVGPDDAADVVSSAVLRVLRSLAWRSVSDHESYLYRAVTNEARNLYRSESRRRLREERAPALHSVEIPEPHLEVRAAIEQLSVRQRAVVFLTYWDDMSDREVADHLGISVGSVHRHLARARRHLRKVLDDHVT